MSLFVKKQSELLSKIRRKIAFSAAFFLVVVLFLFTNKKNIGIVENSEELNKASAANEIIELNEFSLSFLNCELVDQEKTCTPVESDSIKDRLFSFPLSQENINLLSPYFSVANRVLMEHKITSKMLDFSKKHNFGVILLARSVQKTGVLNVGGALFKSSGWGKSLVYHFESELLQQTSRTIRLTLDTQKKVIFGPLELPIVLTTPLVWESLIFKSQRLEIAGLIATQMDLAISVLISAVAFVLDHSRIFGVSALYAVLRSARSFFLSQIPDASSDYLFFIKYSYFLINGLSASLFSIFCLQLSQIREFKALSYFLLSLFVTLLVYFGSRWNYQENTLDSIVTVDLIADGLGAGLGILILALGLLVHLYRNKTTQERQTHEEEYSRLSEFWFISRILIMIFSSVITLYVNASDLIDVSDLKEKSPLDWKHAVSMPIMISVALIHVGSITKKIKEAAKKEVKSAVLKNEVAIASQMQKRTLPRKKLLSPEWSWKSYYKPASALAGDWYDIREVFLANGKKLLLGCVVDITGHGVGPAMVTSVLCSQWSLWNEEFVSFSGEYTKETKQNALSRGVQRMHTGLVSLKKGDACTAVAFLIDLEFNELTYVTCGHPGMLLQNLDDHSVKYLRTMAHSLGETSGSGAKDLSHWPSQTYELPKSFGLGVYSDGLIPLDVSMTSWLKSIEKGGRKDKISVAKTLLNQLRVNRKIFSERENEADDITLVLVAVIACRDSVA